MPPEAVPGQPTPITIALEALTDRLGRVLHFDNDTKKWTFYEPGIKDLSLYADMILDFIVAGEVYLIQVAEPATPVLNGTPRNLTCSEENCWNQLVW